MNTVKLALGTSAAMALAVASLAGCNSGTTPASAAASTSPAAAASTAAAASAPTSASTSVSAASDASAGTPVSASGTACRTSDLSLQVIQGAQEQSSPGSFYIQLANVSSGTCTLYGFPGVDLTGSDGTSLGMKDVWSDQLAMSGGKKVQTLAPGAASAAFVTYAVKPAAQTAGDPRAVEVRVIPPNQTTALTAKIDNLYQGDIQLPVVSKTLTVGPMDIDGIPHR
jgi:Protein of unknown function (DUF4232)